MTQTITFFIVLVLVFVILPAVLKKLTGRDFTELLVGRRLSGQRSNRKEDGGTGGENTGEKSAEREGKKEKNSTKADILRTLSDIAAFARRNQYYAIIPGILRKGELETKLPAILVMRSGVVGINLFGYGGSVSAKKDDPEWTQTINGESRQIPSPIQASEAAKQALGRILAQIGYGEVEVNVISAFTQKDVRITGPMASEVIRSGALTGELGKSRYVRTKNVDVKDVGSALAVFQVRGK